MMMTEIKELFAEELTLLKKIQKYGKEHSQGEPERIEKVKVLLSYRIYSNLYSCRRFWFGRGCMRVGSGEAI